jgi:hypothetical protein
VLAAQHLLDLGLVDLRLERIERALEIGGDVFALPRPFEQDAEVFDLGREGVAQLEVFAQAPTTLQRLLGVGLVFPEVRRADPLFDLRDLVSDASGVKDSSADRGPASKAPVNAEPDRR